jgi:hypothetical protein
MDDMVFSYMEKREKQERDVFYFAATKAIVIATVWAECVPTLFNSIWMAE